MTTGIKTKRQGIFLFFLCLSLVVSNSWADIPSVLTPPFEPPPIERRLDPTAWISPYFDRPACQVEFMNLIGNHKLGRLEFANIEIEHAIQNHIATESWLRAQGYLQDGTEEYIKADQRRTGYRQLLFPKAYTGALFPTTTRKPGASANNKTRIAVDPDYYDGLIIFIPGIGFSVSVADSVTEIAQAFSKAGNAGMESEAKLSREKNKEFVMPDGRLFRALGIPLDVTLNGMASDAPYPFGSRRGSMAMIRHVHLILHALYPHLKIAIAGRSQGGLLSLAYGQTHSDFGLVGTIANSPTYPRGEILQWSNRLNCDLEEKKRRHLDTVYHPYSWRSYLEFTERDYARVINDKSKVRSMIHLAEFDDSYPQPLHTESFKDFALSQPSGFFEVIRGAHHHFWSRPGGHYEEQFNQSVKSMVNFLAPVFYPQPI